MSSNAAPNIKDWKVPWASDGFFPGGQQL